MALFCTSNVTDICSWFQSTFWANYSLDRATRSRLENSSWLPDGSKEVSLCSSLLPHNDHTEFCNPDVKALAKKHLEKRSNHGAKQFVNRQNNFQHIAIPRMYARNEWCRHVKFLNSITLRTFCAFVWVCVTASQFKFQVTTWTYP